MSTSKKAASIDDLGELHAQVTEGYSKALKRESDMADRADSAEAEEGVFYAPDINLLKAAASWISANNIGPQVLGTAGSEAKDQLDELRRRRRRAVTSLVSVE